MDHQNTLCADAAPPMEYDDFVRTLRTLLAAVAALLAVKVASLDRYEGVIAERHCVSTGVGEELLTVLPDGSRVRMAPESELAYALTGYNDLSRRVDWIGEGDFEVASNPASPFTLHTEAFDVRVLGTTFSVAVRHAADSATVYLSAGSIVLTAPGAPAEGCRLTPGDLATVNAARGTITVSRPADFRGDLGAATMSFCETPLPDVLARMGRYYPRRFAAAPELAGEAFTGALPKTNMSEALLILEKAFNAEAVADSAVAAAVTLTPLAQR